MKTGPDVGATTRKGQTSGVEGTIPRQVAEARHSQSVLTTPIDGSINEIGCEEGKRDCSVDLADAAALAVCTKRKSASEAMVEYKAAVEADRAKTDRQRAATAVEEFQVGAEKPFADMPNQRGFFLGGDEVRLVAQSGGVMPFIVKQAQLCGQGPLLQAFERRVSFPKIPPRGYHCGN